MPYYLGVDGGGTKTAFVLVDGDARAVARAAGPASYAFAVGLDGVRQVLRDGVASVLGSAGIGPDDVASAFFALPGYGESSALLPALDRLPAEVLGHGRASAGNDAVAGWAGSLGGEDGINVVAGTGSIAYGELRGASARAGGWGELFGDEGSGYWTAIRGLHAFSRMSDGRAPDGPLRRALLDAVGATTDLDVVGTVLEQWGGDRGRIAALSRAVTRAADEGDETASGILAEAGRELALLVAALRARLAASDDEQVALSYSGGMFTVPAVVGAFRGALGDGFALQEPRFGPAVGAALVAMRRAGALPAR